MPLVKLNSSQARAVALKAGIRHMEKHGRYEPSRDDEEYALSVFYRLFPCSPHDWSGDKCSKCGLDTVPDPDFKREIVG